MAITGDGRNFSTTPGMGLRLYTVGVCGALGIEPPGLSHGEIVNANFGTLDSHNHGPGSGAQIPSAGLAINADVSWGANNITSLRAARFGAIALASLTASDIGCLIVSGADLYYVDTAGNQVRLTSGGGVAGTPGSISGLASPAAASYTPASKLFAFTSSSGFAANLSCGPLSIGDSSASGGKTATIKVPNALAANYNLTLPGALPGVTSFVTLDATGAIAAGPALSAGLTTSHLSSSAGILGSQLSASAGILGSQLSANTVARGQLAAVGQQVSASSGAFSSASAAAIDITNLSVTITTTGRPVILLLVPDGNAVNSAYINSGTNASNLWFDRGGTVIALWSMTSSSTDQNLRGSGLTYIDAVAAGTYTYKARCNPGGTTVSVSYWKLVAYEL